MTKAQLKTLKVGDKVRSLIHEVFGAEQGKLYEVTEVFRNEASCFGYRVCIKLDDVESSWPMALHQIEVVKTKQVKVLRKRIEKGK